MAPAEERAPDARRATVVVAFVVAPDVPHRIATEAIERGLAAVREALAGRARAYAHGSMSSVADGRRVRVELELRGEGALAENAPAAGDAFAEAFLQRIHSRGEQARRVA